jgi:hypothetical protein
MAEKSAPSFEEAVTIEWKDAYQRDIVGMSPVQKYALKQAWAEVESKAADAARGPDRAIARMGTSEFNNFAADEIHKADLAKAGK